MNSLLVLLGLIGFVGGEEGQLPTTPFVIGHSVKLESKMLGEERVLNIYLPPAYEKEKEARFPVIYVLDGSAHEDYLHLVGLVQFCNMYQLVPESIVVGIANVDRYRDFTTPTKNKEDLKNLPTSGGSAKFIDFLEKELQPFIAKHYRSAPDRTIIGQSLGGLLVTEVLVKRPSLFENYLIVSPSLWWNEGALLGQVPEFIKANPKLSKKVYVAVGEEHPVMKADAKKLHELLQGLPQVQNSYKFFPDEDHATVLHQAAYYGFRALHPKKEKKE